MIVTGAAQGLGFHFCRRIAEAGGSVAAGDVNAEGLAKLAEETKSLPGKVFTRTLETSASSSPRLVKRWAG